MRLFPDEFCAVADARGGRPLYTFVEESGAERATLSGRQAWSRATVIAGMCRAACGLAVGDRALLVYQPGLEFIEAMLGCMLAGVVPVPVPLPLGGRDGGVQALGAVAKDCQASVLMTSEMLRAAGAVAAMREGLHALGVSVECFVTDTHTGPEVAHIAETGPEALAFLQYTSGSTRAPRGVEITYANLRHQLADQEVKLRCSADGCIVFWMPHYHDFALISAVMGGAHGLGRVVMCSPVAFLRRPALWGELLTRYRATQTAGPDFGYKLLAERTSASERAGWDLSAMRGMGCGAEPIRATTVDKLMAALLPCGLDPRAFAPCYGLAEHTVAATMFGSLRRTFSRGALEHERKAVPGQGTDAITLFGCGTPSDDVQVRIVEPDTRRALAAGSVGEIWLDSPSKARGYFGRAEDSVETFAATLADEEGRWLRTGDLGMMVDGELFVTGRLKDLVILAGRNIYPQDVEELACQAHQEIRPGHVACFSLERDGEERLVIVAELKAESPTPDARRAVRRAVHLALQAHLQLLGAILVLARRGQVARTTSGKVRRSACKQAWLDGHLALHEET